MNTNNSGHAAQSLLAFVLSLIASVTFRVAGRCWNRANTQVLWIVVLLAELTLTPVGVSASVKCSRPHLDKKMVGVILTDQQVLGAFQVATKRTFDHQDVGPVVTSDVIPVMDFFVLVDVPSAVQSRVFAYSLLSISVGKRNPIPNHCRAPKVCAESTTNLTHSGGNRG